MARNIGIAGLFALVCGSSATLVAAPAAASTGHIFHLAQVGTADRPLVVAASDRGIVFIGADNKVFRAFHHDRRARAGSAQSWFWIDDIDGDKRDEFVGAGSPSFVVDDNADPMWGITGGCDQFFVGDFTDSNATVEMFCRQGNKMQVWSFDGTKVFEWAGTGYSFGNCYADDYDSDRKMEVACDFTSKKKHMFFDPDAEPDSKFVEREGEAPESEMKQGVDEAGQAGRVNGSEPIETLGGDITVRQADGAVVIERNAAMVGTINLPGAIYSAVAADLNGDGKSELYLGGADNVFVVDSEGKLIATVASNPDRARREARVTVKSATANGLTVSDRDQVKAAVEKAAAPIQKCYSDNMGRDQFTRVGDMLFEVTVNKQGKAVEVVKRHSSLANRDLETCVGNAIKKIGFSAATADKGTVNLRLEFYFVDAL